MRRRWRIVVGLISDVVKVGLMDDSDCGLAIDYVHSLVHLVI